MKAPTLGEVKAFVAVADHLNFAHAAVELEVSASTLSSTIRLLEDRLGMRLLNRTTRHVALTAAGQTMLVHWRPMIENYSAALDAAHAMQSSPAGLVRLLVTPTAAHFFLMPAMSAFLAEYPHISIEISSRATKVDVVDEAFDAGIQLNHHVDRDMIAIRVSDAFRTVVVGTPQYLKKHPPIEAPSDLKRHNCIRLREYHGGIIPWRLQNNGKNHVLALNGSMVVSDVSLMVLAALDGIGLAQTTLNFARPMIEDGRLVRLLEDWELEYDGFYLYYPGHRQVPVHLRVLIDFLTRRPRKPGQMFVPSEAAGAT